MCCHLMGQGGYRWPVLFAKKEEKKSYCRRRLIGRGDVLMAETVGDFSQEILERDCTLAGPDRRGNLPNGVCVGLMRAGASLVIRHLCPPPPPPSPWAAPFGRRMSVGRRKSSFGKMTQQKRNTKQFGPYFWRFVFFLFLCRRGAIYGPSVSLQKRRRRSYLCRGGTIWTTVAPFCALTSIFSLLFLSFFFFSRRAAV